MPPNVSGRYVGRNGMIGGVGCPLSAGGNCCQMSVRSQMATVEKELNSSQKHPLVAVAAVEAESLSNVSAIHAVRIAFFESPPAQAPPPVSSILRI